MQKYDSIADPGSRKRFLQCFKENGSKDLKWACEFKATLIDIEMTKIQSNGNFLTPGEILLFNGRSWDGFAGDVDRAMEDVKYLVAKNQTEHGWTDEQHPPRPDLAKPEYSKFYYIKDLGKNHSFTQEQRKEFSAKAAMKNLNQLKNGMEFLEATGFEEESEVNIESVKHATMLTKCEALK